MWWRIFLSIAFLAHMPCPTVAQVKAAQSRVVELPNGPLTRIPAPNRRWTLVFECPDNCRERDLWIEDSSHARRLVNKYERSLAVGWAPDGERFFVNDDFGSNGSECFVIDPIMLKSTDIGTLISRHSVEAVQFLKAGHSYVRAKHWISSHELLVAVFGHFDEAPPRGVPAAFTAEYKVDLKEGGTQKIFQHSVEEPQ